MIAEDVRDDGVSGYKAINESEGAARTTPSVICDESDFVCDESDLLHDELADGAIGHPADIDAALQASELAAS